VRPVSHESLLLAWHEQTERECDGSYRLGYRDGYADALKHAAERVDNLHATWRTVPRLTHEEKVSQRIADMESAFRRAFPDRKPSRGGPVPVWDGPIDTTAVAAQAKQAADIAANYPIPRCSRCDIDLCRCAPSGPSCRCRSRMCACRRPGVTA
jgi:hypothetical protein